LQTPKPTARPNCFELGLTPDEAALFNRLATTVIFTNSGLRDLDAVAANRLGQSRLWPYSISGDLPIVLVRVTAIDDETVVRQLIQWRMYTRRRGLKLDLVIVDERPGEPAERLQKELQTGVAGEIFGKPGGVFFLTAEKVPDDDRVLLAAAARAVFGSDRGSLSEQIDRGVASPAALSPQLTPSAVAVEFDASPVQPPEELSFWNGFGGFTRDGREYVIVIDDSSQNVPLLAAISMDQCAGESAIRMFSYRGWSRLQLGLQQSNEPPHSLVQ
jgi:cellobiose phosphorylase